jgi:hypothetical protein
LKEEEQTPTTILRLENLQRDLTSPFHNAIPTRYRTSARIVTLVDRVSTVQHLAPQTLPPLPYTVIYVNLVILLHFILIHGIIPRHVLQAVTAFPLTLSVIDAFAAGAESVFGALDARGEDRVLDEAEVGGEAAVVYAVYYGDGVGGVGGEGADLTPVAGGALFFEGLACVRKM